MRGIAVAGTMLVDHLSTVPAYPKEGALVQIAAVSKAVGGCVPNVALDLKRLCPALPVFAVGCVGSDADGAFITDTLSAAGVDTRYIRTLPHSATAHTQVISVAGGQRTFFTYPGAAAQLCAADVPTDRLPVGLLHLGYLLLLEKIDAGDARDILQAATACSIKTSVDLVSEESDRYRQVLPFLPLVDYLIVNETEGGGLAGIAPTADNLPQIAAALLARGVREKVILHHKGGAVCCGRDGVTVLPALSLPTGYIQGTTGAGDAFCAGALLAVSRGLSDRDILHYGRVAAAMSLRTTDATSGLAAIENYLTQGDTSCWSI